MKEYRIKARSADHRRAIIGALEGMGVKYTGHSDKGEMEYPIIGVKGSEMNGWPRRSAESTVTHTSLDSLLEDIERDRRTVEVKYDGDILATVTTEGIALGVSRLSFINFDRIAAAVKQVRG